MAFDFSTLVTDRTLEDVANKTAKGFYNATDLNRVDACLEDLVDRLGRMGCNVPGYERLKIERAVTPSSRLPDGYTEVEFIKSSGTQYVDLGFKPNQNTKFEVDVKINNTKCHVFGARTKWKQKAFAIYWSSNDENCIQVADLCFNGGVFDTANRHKIVMTASKLYFDGELKASYSVGNFQCEQNAWLMSCYSSSPSEYAHGNLYLAKIYDNGELIRDCIPCIDPSGTVGIYDAVDEKFYGNAGTGVFLAGPPRATLPEGYTQLEYIQSSGTQYIDTGFRPNQASRVDMVAQMPAILKYPAFFGTRAGSKALFWLYANDAETAIYGYGSAKPRATCTMTDLLAIKADANMLYVNGDVLITAATSTFETDFPLYLFAVNNSGQYQYPAGMKLYQCKISDQKGAARFFIPCKNDAGAVGLYDVVGREFYGNAGTGNFEAGPTVTWDADVEQPSEELDPYTWYETDTPTFSQISQYRANVEAVRAVLRLPEGTPGVPETMRRLRPAEANSIEKILLALNFILNNIPAAVRHCGVTVCGSKGVRA